MLKFDKSTYLSPLSLLFKSISSKRLSDSLRGSDVSLFPEFINIVSILFYNFIELIILLYTFLVISFAQYREYIGLNILSCVRSKTLVARAKSQGREASIHKSPLPFCCS